MRILIIILLFFGQNELRSCSCAYFESKELSNLEASIEGSDWIGIGNIKSANLESYPAIYEFQIRILYKGSEQVKTVQTGLGGPDCGFHFEVDEEYIIYGAEIGEDLIETNRCTRTNKISNSIDYDYLNKRFIDNDIKLGWNETVVNFIQFRINNQVDIANPPLLVDKNYKVISIETIMEKYPNSYLIEKLDFNSRELQKMNRNLKDKAVNNGIIVVKALYSKFKKRKMMRKLNRQLK